MSHFYKNLQETQVKVGFFILICLAILFFAYSWLGDWFIGRQFTTIQVLFEEVGNLEKGNTVFFRGVRVGKINGFQMRNDGVLVFLLIEKSVPIDKKAQFFIKDKDMMGSKCLEIMPGHSLENVSPDEVYIGQNIPGLVDLIANLNLLFDQLESFLALLGNKEEVTQKIEKIVIGVDNGLTSLNKMITELNQSDLLETFTELKRTSASISRLIENNTENISTTFTRIDSLLIHTVDLVSDWQDKMNHEDSNFDKFFTDGELYENLLRSSVKLDSLLTDVKKNPRKYFKITVF